MGTHFFYKKAKTFIDPTMDDLARYLRKIKTHTYTSAFYSHNSS